MAAPTAIDLPSPPSEPATPTDMGPGTPNSGTTSLSALSTVAFKDGHQGARHHHRSHRPRRSSDASESSTTTLDAERADRISRLAGLGRVGATNHQESPGFAHSGAEYFDSSAAHMIKERSTVGSASATGSIGGRTTWASSSDFDQDRSIDDVDDGVSSMGGLSDEGNASLVGFGEGASSTMSGPVSTGAARVAMLAQQQQQQSPSSSGSLASGQFSRSVSMQSVPHPLGVPSATSHPTPPTNSAMDLNTPDESDAQMLDGMTYDEDIVDTTFRPPLPVDTDEYNFKAHLQQPPPLQEKSKISQV